MAPSARSSALAGRSVTDAVGVVVVGGLALWLTGLATLVALVGAPYYVTAVSARPDHALHPWFRSGAGVGLMCGVVGTTLLFGMLSYSLRKWVGTAPALGPPEWWLRFHQVCGLLGPTFIILHSGIVWPSGLVAVGYWCMLLVAVSGIFGRYLFGHIPGQAAAKASELAQVRQELHVLRDKLVSQTARSEAHQLVQAVQLVRTLDMQPRGVFGLALLDLEVARRKEHVRVLMWRAGLPPAIRDRATATLLGQLALMRSLASWHVARRLFRYWHLFHEPLAVAMYAIAVFHISTALLFGGVSLPGLGAP